MRAAVLQGLGEPLRVDMLPDPEPAPGQIVVRVDACGICGSDLHMAESLPLTGVVLGHEVSGSIVDVGPNVNGWAEGDRVAVFPVSGCSACEACLSGMPSKCIAASMIGLMRPGGFAEYVIVDATEAHRLPASIDAQFGALVEPLAVGLHAVDLAGVAEGEQLLILGGGAVGQAVALWARSMGAGEVVVSDPVPERRHAAEALAATATVDPGSDDVGDAFEKIAGKRPTNIIECVGVGGMIQHAVDVAGNDAHVTVVGVCVGPDQIMPLSLLQKEMSMRFALYYRRADFARTTDALEHELIDPAGLVTDIVDLDALPRHFEDLKQPSTGGKTQLVH